MDSSMYRPPPAATPGWQFAPVPGWGTNPLRAGPERVGVGCLPCALGQENTSEARMMGFMLVGAGLLAIVSIALLQHHYQGSD